MHGDGDRAGDVNGVAGMGHNQAAAHAVQWQRPHLPAEPDVRQAAPPEADLDLVEVAFSDGFAVSRDPTSFLRVAQVPFEAVAPDGKRVVLLRVEIDAVADVGSVTPHLGGASFRYDPLPARMVSNRRSLRFIYFDGS